MKIPKIPRSIIPNSFTAFNIFSGFASMIMSAAGKFEEAVLLILIAAVCDALDGLLARLTKSTSQFGVELDSLADVVSFGAAPSLLIYHAHLYTYDVMGIILSAFPIVFGALRLARFNVQLDGFDKTVFSGLPIPFAAITLSAFIYVYNDPIIGLTPPFHDLLIPLVLFISLMMVSKIKYETLPKLTPAGVKEKPHIFIYVLISAVALILTNGDAVFMVLFFAIFFGVLRHIFTNFFFEREEKLKNNLE
ncbi:MAG: CDP-diacylglycerol--serine O-phosphatidyltransferase [Melioribacteraceae bacterium]|nr:CDP-diacylglycerol--serine O-phosphatidyltransferase [Melioribacteraceae bacterium]